MTALQIPFLIALALSQDAATSPYYFGQHPLGDVHVAVNYYAPYAGNGKCSIDPNAFFAYMLAPTWWEVAGQSRSNTPSPMTLSRGDDGTTLYAPGGAQYRRAFWHTGIGMWQLDDAGDGMGLSVEKFNSISSSLQVALKMADRYCSDTSYFSIWRIWCACASTGHCSAPDRDRCIPTATNIINNVPIVEDPSTDSSGGTEMRTCSLPGQAQVFQCFYVKPTVPPAQGYTGWISSPDGTPPLAKPFYVYKQWPDGTDGNSYEWRYWMAEDTGFGQDFAARRNYLTAATTKLCWISASGSTPASCNLSPSSLGLCDVTASRGACGGSCPPNSCCLPNGVVLPASSCPPPTCYPLTLADNNPTGGGFPTTSPPNSSVCSAGQFLAGENIQLTAYPANGWNVGSWTGTQNDGSTSTTNTVVMPASAWTVTVNYVQAPQTGAPTVTTGGVDAITATAATVHGTVNPNGLGTDVYFGYTTDQVNYSYTPPQYIGISTGPFLANLSGLACQTSYWYYAIAYNSAGGIGGYLQPFTTASCAAPPIPSVLSASVDGITQASAVLHASVDPNGVPTNVYFLYDTTTNTGNSTPSTSLSGSGAQPVSIPISGLSCGITYYYRPIAYNTNTGQGTTLDWQSFNSNSCSASGTFFYTATPCRVLDTRPPVNAPISASSGRAIQIAGLCGIPSTATAVAMNVTAVGATSQGILSVYPAGSVPPNYTVAFGAGQVRAASTVIGLSSFGTVMVAFFTPSGQGQTDFIIDVSGYFQ